MSSKMDIASRVVLGVFAALFVFAAAVQFNDVDPWTWVVAYGVAALLCAMSAADVQLPVSIPVGIGAIALAWSAYLAWIVFVTGDAQAMYPAETKDPALLDLEEAREMFGLVLIAAATAIAAYRERSEA